MEDRRYFDVVEEETEIRSLASTLSAGSDLEVSEIRVLSNEDSCEDSFSGPFSESEIRNHEQVLLPHLPYLYSSPEIRDEGNQEGENGTYRPRNADIFATNVKKTGCDIVMLDSSEVFKLGTQNGKKKLRLSGVNGSTNQNGMSNEKHLYDGIVNSIYPWMEYYNHLMKGYPDPKTGIRLFDTDCIQAATDKELMPYGREIFFIDLFFQKRFFAASRVKRSSPSVYQFASQWSEYVIQVNKDSTSWWKTFLAEKRKFLDCTYIGRKMDIHITCMKENLACGIPTEQNCPMCYADSKKLPSKARSGNSKMCEISKELKDKIEAYDHAYYDKHKTQIKISEDFEYKCQHVFRRLDDGVKELQSVSNAQTQCSKSNEQKLITLGQEIDHVRKKVNQIIASIESSKIMEEDIKQLFLKVSRLERLNDRES